MDLGLWLSCQPWLQHLPRGLLEERADSPCPGVESTHVAAACPDAQLEASGEIDRQAKRIRHEQHPVGTPCQDQNSFEEPYQEEHLMETPCQQEHPSEALCQNDQGGGCQLEACPSSAEDLLQTNTAGDTHTKHFIAQRPVSCKASEMYFSRSQALLQKDTVGGSRPGQQDGHESSVGGSRPGQQGRNVASVDWIWEGEGRFHARVVDSAEARCVPATSLKPPAVDFNLAFLRPQPVQHSSCHLSSSFPLRIGSLQKGEAQHEDTSSPTSVVVNFGPHGIYSVDPETIQGAQQFPSKAELFFPGVSLVLGGGGHNCVSPLVFSRLLSAIDHTKKGSKSALSTVNETGARVQHHSAELVDWSNACTKLSIHALAAAEIADGDQILLPAVLRDALAFFQHALESGLLNASHIQE